MHQRVCAQRAAETSPCAARSSAARRPKPSSSALPAGGTRARSATCVSAHAIAWIVREAGDLVGKTVLVNLSGRGDKDVEQLAKRAP